MRPQSSFYAGGMTLVGALFVVVPARAVDDQAVTPASQSARATSAVQDGFIFPDLHEDVPPVPPGANAAPTASPGAAAAPGGCAAPGGLAAPGGNSALGGCAAPGGLAAPGCVGGNSGGNTPYYYSPLITPTPPRWQVKAFTPYYPGYLPPHHAPKSGYGADGAACEAGSVIVEGSDEFGGYTGAPQDEQTLKHLGGAGVGVDVYPQH